MTRALKVDQFFVPGVGWFDCKPLTVAALGKMRLAKGATHVRVIGHGDYSLAEIPALLGRIDRGRP